MDGQITNSRGPSSSDKTTAPIRKDGHSIRDRPKSERSSQHRRTGGGDRGRGRGNSRARGGRGGHGERGGRQKNHEKGRAEWRCVSNAHSSPPPELINEAVRQSTSEHVTRRIEKLPNGGK